MTDTDKNQLRNDYFTMASELKNRASYDSSDLTNLDSNENKYETEATVMPNLQTRMELASILNCNRPQKINIHRSTAL